MFVWLGNHELNSELYKGSHGCVEDPYTEELKKIPTGLKLQDFADS